MALGNWNNNDTKEFVNLKLSSVVWPTDEKPMFVKLWADFKETSEKYSMVEWKLIKIKWSFTPAKWRMWDIYWFKAFFEDEKYIYVIESTITNASKDLLNALLVNLWKELKVVLYLNKNWYPTSSVKLADWNYAQTAFEYNKLDIKELFNAIEKTNEWKENVTNDSWINIEDIF